jgi:hypothetical protein
MTIAFAFSSYQVDLILYFGIYYLITLVVVSSITKKGDCKENGPEPF